MIQVSTSQSPRDPVKAVELVSMRLALNQRLNYSIQLTITGTHSLPYLFKLKHYMDLPKFTLIQENNCSDS